MVKMKNDGEGRDVGGGGKGLEKGMGVRMKEGGRYEERFRKRRKKVNR